MQKRFIITELENGDFILYDKKESKKIMTSNSFEDVFAEAKKLANGKPVFGITNIKDPVNRHVKFQSFKIPVRCSYEIK